MSAAASYWRNAVRHPEDCGIGNIRRTMDYSEFGNVAGEYPAYALPIGCLEKGAIPIRISTYVQTAVTGGTPAVTIGTATDPDAFAVAADIAAGSTGYKTAATGAEMGKALTADTMFFAYISASASAGKFTVTVEFANRRESVPFREESEDSGNGEEGGESSAPAWVPEGAVLHIDFVGGTPQGRAWTEADGEVAIDTLLGTDPNTETGYAASAYNPAHLGLYGYQGNAVSTSTIALIGPALAYVLPAGTLVIRSYNQYNATLSSGRGAHVFHLLSDGGIYGAGVGAYVRLASSYAGNLEGETIRGDFANFNLVDVLNLPSVGVDVSNKWAITMTPTRGEFAANGSAPQAALLTEDDSSPEDPMVSALVTASGPGQFLQSITLYDPLPSAGGLSDLSAP